MKVTMAIKYLQYIFLPKLMLLFNAVLDWLRW